MPQRRSNICRYVGLKWLEKVTGLGLRELCRSPFKMALFAYLVVVWRGLLSVWVTKAKTKEGWRSGPCQEVNLPFFVNLASLGNYPSLSTCPTVQWRMSIKQICFKGTLFDGLACSLLAFDKRVRLKSLWTRNTFIWNLSFSPLLVFRSRTKS